MQSNFFKKKERKLLGIAFEPWETKIVTSVLTRWKHHNPDFEVAVLIGDIYQLINSTSRTNLKNIEMNFPGKLFTLEDAFNSWISSKSSDGLWEESCLRWEKCGNINVSSGVLSSSEVVFSPYERSPYYYPIEFEKKNEIFLRIASEVKRVLEVSEPDLVWTIERNYLVKNLCYAICDVEAIPFKSLVPSRIGSNWIFVDGFGMKKGENPFISRNIDKMTANNERVWFKERLASREKQVTPALYVGGTEKEVDKLQRFRLHPFKSLFSEGKFVAKKVYQISKGRILQRTKISVGAPFSSDARRTIVFSLLRSFRRVSYSLFGNNYLQKSIPQGSYFFYPLHVRPESSTSTLGRGVYDELCLSFLLSKLPCNVKLVVKENPAAVCDRRRSWYRRYSKKEQIVFTDPLVSSAQLISNSIGVIGISGTALLEATLLGRPAYALGSPEFQELLSGHGFDGLEKFLVQSIRGEIVPKTEKAFEYIGATRRSSIAIAPSKKVVQDDAKLNMLSSQIADELDVCAEELLLRQ